jgi:hypothetical protein
MRDRNRRAHTGARKSRTTSIILTAAVLGGAVAAVVATPAWADDGKGDVVVYREPGVVTVTIPGKNVKTKSSLAPVKQPPGAEELALSCGNACYLFPDSSRTVTPPGGSSGTLRTRGSTNYVPYYVPILGNLSKMDFYNTNSSSAWLGSSPFNCTSVKHQDVWDVDFIGVSWSYGGAPSGTIVLGTARIGYENTVSNTWRVSHSVQHVFLSTTGDIYWTGYEAHGSYQFGSQFFTVDAYSSVWLPG